MKLEYDKAKSNLLKIEFDWWKTIQAREKLPLSMQYSYWVCSDRSLDVVSMVIDVIEIVWRVS